MKPIPSLGALFLIRYGIERTSQATFYTPAECPR